MYNNVFSYPSFPSWEFVGGAKTSAKEMVVFLILAVSYWWLSDSGGYCDWKMNLLLTKQQKKFFPREFTPNIYVKWRNSWMLVQKGVCDKFGGFWGEDEAIGVLQQ